MIAGPFSELRVGSSVWVASEVGDAATVAVSVAAAVVGEDTGLDVCVAEGEGTVAEGVIGAATSGVQRIGVLVCVWREVDPAGAQAALKISSTTIGKILRNISAKTPIVKVF